MGLSRFLAVHHKTVSLFLRFYEFIETPRGEKIHLFRLGNWGAYGVWEIVAFDPGSPYLIHRHQKTDSLIRILWGDGIASIGGTEKPFRAGCVLDVPMNVSHGFKTKRWLWMLTRLSRPIMDPVTRAFDFEYVNDEHA